MQFPEYFAEMVEEYGLPIPPIPLSAIPYLEEREPAFFATDARPFTRNLHYINLDSLDILRRGAGFSFAMNMPQAMESHEDDVRYVACGLRGYGLQNRYFCYALETASLRIALSVPWGNIYGDAESEYKNLEGLLQVVEICQRVQGAMKEGRVLEIALGNQCAWQLMAETENMDGHAANPDAPANPANLANPDSPDWHCIAQGDTITSLLDYIVTADMDNNLDPRAWIRV